MSYDEEDIEVVCPRCDEKITAVVGVSFDLDVTIKGKKRGAATAAPRIEAIAEAVATLEALIGKSEDRRSARLAAAALVVVRAELDPRRPAADPIEASRALVAALAEARQ